MRDTRWSAAMLVCALTLVVPAQENGTEPTAAEFRDRLLQTLEPLDLRNESVRTIAIEGVSADLHRSYTLRCRDDGTYELSLFDPGDGEPFVVGLDGVTLSYMPRALEPTGRIVLSAGRALVSLKLAEGQLSWGIATIADGVVPPEERAIVDLDFGSVLAGITETLNVVKREGGGHVLSGASKRGTRVVTTVDLSAPYPIVAFSVTPPGMTTPLLDLRKIEVNSVLPDRALALPTVGALSEIAHVDDLRGANHDPETANDAFVAATNIRLWFLRRAGSDDVEERAFALRDRRERAALGALLRKTAVAARAPAEPR